MRTSALHKNYLLIHKFEHETEPKKWVADDKTYTGDYHKDYLWIMPVVEKIEATPSKEDNDFYYTVKIEGNSVSIVDNFGEFEVAHGSGENKIAAIYEAVVNFIKWYNG